jgi:hypothetical protein
MLMSFLLGNDVWFQATKHEQQTPNITQTLTHRP